MVDNPKASMYIWAKIPEAYAKLGSIEFAKKLLADAKVAVSPGIGFGDYGDDHVRIALIENESAHPAGGARHQGDVPQGRAAVSRIVEDQRRLRGESSRPTGSRRPSACTGSCAPRFPPALRGEDEAGLRRRRAHVRWRVEGRSSPASRCTGSTRTPSTAGSSTVDDLVTDEKRRSTGVGRALLSYLERKARAANLDNISRSTSGTQRQQAHKFYFREGMVGAPRSHFGKKLK